MSHSNLPPHILDVLEEARTVFKEQPASSTAKPLTRQHLFTKIVAPAFDDITQALRVRKSASQIERFSEGMSLRIKMPNGNTLVYSVLAKLNGRIYQVCTCLYHKRKGNREGFGDKVLTPALSVTPPFASHNVIEDFFRLRSRLQGRD